jgi:hypothetical protein
LKKSHYEREKAVHLHLVQELKQLLLKKLLIQRKSLEVRNVAGFHIHGAVCKQVRK